MTTTGDKQENDIELLLPWHAAGTLSRDESRAVDEALRRDQELAHRYALVRAELGETIELNEKLGVPSARIMNNLFARIDAEPVRRPSVTSRFTTGIAGFFAGLAPRTLALAGGAAAIAILLQAGIIGTIMFKQQPGATYQTASSTGTPDATGTFALMRFSPQATQDDVTKFLAANKFSIVAGPMNGGLYRVKIAAEIVPQADIAGRIQALQGDKVVNFIALTQ